jgi:hypothetical protein
MVNEIKMVNEETQCNMNRDVEREYMKKSSIVLVVEQLKLRGEDAILADKLARYDILIKDKDIRIKVKFSKPIQRSKSSNINWEFTKLIHRSRLYPTDIFDFYILVGFGENGDIKKIWKISTEDKLIYRKNQVFISIDEVGEYEEYKKYELKIVDNVNNEGLQWID